MWKQWLENIQTWAGLQPGGREPPIQESKLPSPQKGERDIYKRERERDVHKEVDVYFSRLKCHAQLHLKPKTFGCNPAGDITNCRPSMQDHRLMSGETKLYTFKYSAELVQNEFDWSTKIHNVHLYLLHKLYCKTHNLL